MGKYNSKHEAVKPTEINKMGEMSYKMGDKEELVSTVMTTFLNNGYYETEKEVVDRICAKLDKVDPLFSAKLAIYARNTGNLRSVTHLVSAYISKYISGTEWAKRFYNKIIVRPDDMSEIISAYASLNGMKLNNIKKIPNSMKKGFKASLERLDAYQIDKYKMNGRNVKLIDLVNLFHPKGKQKNGEAYHNLMNGISLEALYSSKILEKEMAKAGQETKGMPITEKEEAKKEAITAVIENVNGMPIMNLLRNLRNIILYAPDKVDDACKQLTIKDKILKSRLLPFRFATAYSEIEKLNYAKDTDTKIEFESDAAITICTKEQFDINKEKVLNAIEDALQISCLNIPKLEGNCAILVDHSGSVRGDAGGSSRVSAFSKTTRAMIGNLFASMVAYRQDNVYIGLFGDRLIPIKIDRSKKLLDFNNYSYNEGAKCGTVTEAGIYTFMEEVVKEKKKIDNIIVFSDCQIGKGSYFASWYGHKYDDRGPHFHELFKEFRKINPNANFIVVNLNQTNGNSVFDRSQRILNIAGWSDKIFDLITSNCKGWDAVIKEIENIEI